MSRIIITGGPTNEPIDEVMKITNMSTGSLSTELANRFLDAGYEVTLVLNNMVKYETKSDNLKLIWIETTDDMLKALEEESKFGCDALIHASAVGDYKSDFSFLLEDLAKEIFEAKPASAEEILKIMEDPKCKLYDGSKISSYQKNLTVKLGLTPKIIARLREWYPDSLLIGCKLLENVPKEELFEVATKLAKKNNMDYIMANDLADLRKGMKARYLVTKEGFTGKTLDEPKDIFEFVDGELK
ncbi:MAG: hypothetical protein MJ146_01390 [Clostridia bacterium]|nr:hypothetical protein [Clostridia bacterium]